MTSDANIHNNLSYIQLKESISYVKGKKPENLSEEFIKGYLPYLSTEYLRKGIVTKYAELTGKVISVVDNEILLLWDGSNAGEFIKGKNGILSSTMVKIKHESKDFVTLYLYYQLKKKEYYLRGLTQGTGIPHVDRNVLMDIRIPRPPLPEQHKIASILSKVDEQISQTEAIIEKTKELKRGLMQQLLTKGIGHTKFKKTEIGEIPEEWDVKKVSDTCKTYAGGTPSRSNKSYYNGSILWVKSGEIDQRFITDTEERITEDALANSSAKLVPKDTVLVAMYGATAGKVGVLKKEGTTNQAVLAVIPKNNTFDYLFMYYLLTSKTNKIISTTQGTGQPNLSKGLIDNVKVQVPLLEEQKNITAILFKVDDQLSQNQSYLSHLQELKKGLMQDLLTGKVRVTV